MFFIDYRKHNENKYTNGINVNKMHIPVTIYTIRRHNIQVHVYNESISTNSI